MVEYKRAAEEDIDVLVDLRMAFLKEICLNPDEIEEGLIVSLREYFLENIKLEKFIAWLAVSDNTVVGTSGLCFNQVPPGRNNLKGEVAYIMNMYTIPAYRKKGIARELFKRTLADAESRGCAKVSLHATEMGEGLYRKFGFKEPSMKELMKYF